MGSQAFHQRPFLKLIVYVLFLALLGVLLFSVEVVRLPLILAVIFFYLLAPLVNRLERRGIGRNSGIAVIYVGLCLILGGGFWILSPWVADGYNQMVEDYPTTMRQLRATGDSLLSRYSDHIPAAVRAGTLQKAFAYVQNSIMLILETLPALVPRIITTLLLVPVFGFFLLRDASRIRKLVLGLVPNRYFEISLKISHMVNKKVGAFIRGRLLEALIVGILVCIGLFAIGVEYAFFHASLAAVLNLIPFIGPIAAAIPALTLSLVHFEGWWMVIGIVCVYSVAQIIDAALIVPAVLAKIIDLHPIWVIIAIFAGGQLYGVVGMIIGVPVVVIAKIAVEESLHGGASLR